MFSTPKPEQYLPHMNLRHLCLRCYSNLNLNSTRTQTACATRTAWTYLSLDLNCSNPLLLLPLFCEQHTPVVERHRKTFKLFKPKPCHQLFTISLFISPPPISHTTAAFVYISAPLPRLRHLRHHCLSLDYSLLDRFSSPYYFKDFTVSFVSSFIKCLY